MTSRMRPDISFRHNRDLSLRGIRNRGHSHRTKIATAPSEEVCNGDLGFESGGNGPGGNEMAYTLLFDDWLIDFYWSDQSVATGECWVCGVTSHADAGTNIWEFSDVDPRSGTYSARIGPRADTREAYPLTVVNPNDGVKYTGEAQPGQLLEAEAWFKVDGFGLSQLAIYCYDSAGTFLTDFTFVPSSNPFVYTLFQTSGVAPAGTAFFIVALRGRGGDTFVYADDVSWSVT